MHKLGFILIVLLAIVRPSIAQNSPPVFISEYYNLLSSNLDTTGVYCDALIDSRIPEKAAFGYAGKGYLATLKSNFGSADSLFLTAEEILDTFNSHKDAELKGHIFLLKALRLIESHELEGAIKFLITITNICNGNCSNRLTYNVQSSLGRAYSLSNQHFKAIQISHDALNDFSQFLERSEDFRMKINYANEIIKLANFMFNLFLEDGEQYSNYLDSAQHYTDIADAYIETHNIQLLKRQIIVKYADNHFHGYKNYAVAKDYFEQALPFYEGENYKKRVEQILFRIAECHFELGEFEQTEEILNRQIEEQIWQEYQLLEFDALSYFYLFRIHADRGDVENAINNTVQYGEKIGNYYKAKNESDLKVNDLYHLESRAKEIKVYVENYNQQSHQKRLFAWLSLLLVAVIVITILFYVHTNKQKLKNIRELNRRIEDLQRDIDKTSSTKSSSLTDADARLLLIKLKELETQELYLRSDYSLNLVAQRLGTNTSYLSKTVNTFLELSFAEYSNRLKVNGIVNKLKKHRHYRNYTIDALAQEAGYKSVNAFNTNFKKLLKVTPSQYLKELVKT